MGQQNRKRLDIMSNYKKKISLFVLRNRESKLNYKSCTKIYRIKVKLYFAATK